MNDLVAKRVIHAVPGASLHVSVSGLYDCYEIDYGIFIRLMRAAEFQTGVAIKESGDLADLRDMTSTTVNHYALDLSRLKTTDVRLCPTCGAEFSANARSYSIRRLCPECFADQPDES